MNLNVVDSENCCYNLKPGNPIQLCGCEESCSLEKACDPKHHIEKKGARKKAIFGVIGVQNEISQVFEQAELIGYRGGIYTLLMNEFDDDLQKGDNKPEISRELEVYKKLSQIDAGGEFTPILLHSCIVKRNTTSFDELLSICRNISEYQSKTRDFESNQHLQNMVRSNRGGIIFMYVSDAGKTIQSYMRMCQKYPSQIRMSPQDVIESTQNFAINYQKLAARQIGHFDLHLNNVTYKMKNGKMCLSMIDFGCDEYFENGKRANYIHFVYAPVHFGFQRSAERYIRPSNPVHYIMFIMAFEILRNCLYFWKSRIGHFSVSQHGRLVSDIIYRMSEGLFIETDNNVIQEVMKSMLGYDSDPKYSESHFLCQSYCDFFYVIKEVYGDFYSIRCLKGIWMRVCEKMEQAVYRYGNANPKYLDEMSISRRDGAVNVFETNKDGHYVFVGMPAYLKIFDDFSMAFYDKEQFSHNINFLKKKYDEFSIARLSIILLKLVYFSRGDNARLEFEIRRVQDIFSPPNFFLKSKYEEVVQVIDQDIDQDVPQRKCIVS